MIQPNANSPQYGNTSDQSQDTATTAQQLPILANGKSSLDYHLRQGQTYYNQYSVRPNPNDLNTALSHFQKAVDIDHTSTEALIGLMNVLWEMGPENSDAIKNYAEQALSIDPACHKAHLYLGYVHQRNDNLQQAIDHFISALKKGPIVNPKARFALAKTLMDNHGQQTRFIGRLHWKLIASAQSLIGIASLPFDWPMLRSMAAGMAHDTTVYAIHWTASTLKNMGLRNLSAKVYKLGNKALPEETVFNHLLGDQYFFDLQSPADAITFYHQAAQQEGNNVDLIKKLGKAYAQASEIEDATEQFLKLLEINPTDFDALYNLGQLYIEQQAYFKSLYYFKEAALIKPRHPFVHSNMGYVLFKLDDMEGALEEYKSALDLGTDAVWLSSVSQTVATIVYKIYGDIDGALDYLQQALHFNPDNRDALATLGDIYFENDYIEMALAAYQALIKVEPENSDCYSNIGYILWQLDRNDEAIAAYNNALLYNDNNCIAHNNLGVIYLDEKNNPAEALTHFAKALILKDDYTLAAFNIGRSNEQLGNTIEAAEAYSKALELNTLNTELDDEEIQERLDILFQ
ncbi:MAG: tetratricopeptide repeat protein [Cyanobacteria bacterium HKST-UBA05]|nr:tetratricopeptide repeat protein [Cyanobacteria bacterium HKST-UBA05]